MFSFSRRAAAPRPRAGLAPAAALASCAIAFAGASALGALGPPGPASAASSWLSSTTSSSSSVSLASSVSRASVVPQPYDVVSSDGRVYNADGAGWYGDLKGAKVPSPIIGMSVMPDGRGYWLAAQNGGVDRFGDAAWYGSLSGRNLRWNEEVVAIRATRDGRGYWLIGRNGSVRSFGDAPRIERLPSQMERRVRPMVAAAVTPSGHGAWLVNAGGDIYTVGEATNYGSLAGKRLSSPITAIADTPDGRGYWLTDSKGDVYGFGDASHARLSSSPSAPIVGLASGGSARSYVAVTSTGVALRSGQSAGTPLRPTGALTRGARVTGIAAASRPTPQTTFPSGSVGFDVNWPQCARPGSSQAGRLPALAGRSLAVVGVDGWAMHSYNSCLGSEVSWARHASAPYELYMFINSPASPRDGDQTGPGGTCSHKSGAAWQRCLAYNYGYNAARQAVGYASAHGAHASMWWLDVENGICEPGMWSAESRGRWWSCDLGLNSVTISGAIAGLRSEHLTVGVYCSAQQWRQITGGYVPAGHIPIWIAGAYWTSPPYPASFRYPGVGANAGYCAGHYDFAGGRVALLQETPGSNHYPYDPDYAC